MADQQRWWKLWTTAPSDSALLALPPALRWAWAVLGCYTKVHGTHGQVKIVPNHPVLAAEMGVKPEALKEVIEQLPNVHVTDVREEGTNRHGEFTVTWENWIKYQEDSTQAARARASRSKKRREEMRREEIRFSPPTPSRERSKAPRARPPRAPDRSAVADQDRTIDDDAPRGRFAARSRRSTSGPESIGPGIREFMATIRSAAPRTDEAQI